MSLLFWLQKITSHQTLDDGWAPEIYHTRQLLSPINLDLKRQELGILSSTSSQFWCVIIFQEENHHGPWASHVSDAGKKTPQHLDQVADRFCTNAKINSFTTSVERICPKGPKVSVRFRASKWPLGTHHVGSGQHPETSLRWFSIPCTCSTLRSYEVFIRFFAGQRFEILIIFSSVFWFSVRS